ncbi:unnamed protein product [Ectocarpus sp. CCAP 1310/34]|nr:unnamed protein product [Ectocarpus sp. CCAP 1310/34]
MASSPSLIFANAVIVAMWGPSAAALTPCLASHRNVLASAHSPAMVPLWPRPSGPWPAPSHACSTPGVDDLEGTSQRCRRGEAPESSCCNDSHPCVAERRRYSVHPLQCEAEPPSSGVVALRLVVCLVPCAAGGSTSFRP